MDYEKASKNLIPARVEYKWPDKSVFGKQESV